MIPSWHIALGAVETVCPLELNRKTPRIIQVVKQVATLSRIKGDVTKFRGSEGGINEKNMEQA